MHSQQLRNILESCLLVAGRAMTVAQLEALFSDDIDKPERQEIREMLLQLQADYENRGIELVEVATGWRLQSRSDMAHWVGRLFEEKPPRYSRALLETLVLIAYRQPITRGEIEEIRGVAVSSNIIRTLQEREWIKEMGFKDVPGRPALWGTTRQFLDYFGLKRLEDLPTMAEARDLSEIESALAAEVGVVDGAVDGEAANDADDDLSAAQAKDDAMRPEDTAAVEKIDDTSGTDEDLARLAAGLPGADPLLSANEVDATDVADVADVDQVIEQKIKPDAEGSEKSPKLSEISAHDLRVEQIPEVDSSQTMPADEDDSEIQSDTGDRTERTEAQTALHEAIADFAEEHRRQLAPEDQGIDQNQDERVAPSSVADDSQEEHGDPGFVPKSAEP
ncbi:MAG: SMC-Scp complex subunit ScpB [Granulosicoccus sp.]